ncbi:MAG: MFS transporter, partial [Alphaproteobacteria bacterium]|nr:MFS transporter [Alphaproteobacteria bacterium]
RKPITWVTLFGGFASTVCWPLSAFLVEQLGWRGACFVYAAIQLGFSLPIHLFVLPSRPDEVAATAADRAGSSLARNERLVFGILATVLTLGAAILSMVGMHLLVLLQARGITLAAAVAFGAMVGPSQVGARVIEMLAGSRYHPIWTMIASAVLVAAGTWLLYLDVPIYAVALVLYGAGNGIGSIARGTLPLALFGAQRYPVLMGRLALPLLIAMSVAPLIGALIFNAAGADGTLGILASMATLNVALVGALKLSIPKA